MLKNNKIIIQNNEKFYKSVLDSSPVFFVAIGFNGKILMMNKALLKILGYTNNEVKGKNYLNTFIPKEDRKKLNKVFKKIILEKKITINENLIESKSGKKYLVEWHGHPVLNASGHKADNFFIGVGVDITKRKQDEERLKEDKKSFYDIFNTVADGILLIDIKTKKIFKANKTFCKMLGYLENEILNLQFNCIHPKKEWPFILREFNNSVHGSFKITKNIPVQRKDKSIFYVDISSNKITINGKIYNLGIFRDVTKRKLFEEKLKESEERFHELFESANDAIWIMKRDIFLDCNWRAVKMFGCKNKEELIGRSPVDFSPISQPDGNNSKIIAFKHIMASLNGHPQRFYWRHKKKDGAFIDTEISLNKIDFSNIKGNNIYVQAIGRDITKRKEIEEKLKESENKFKNIFKYSNIGVSIMGIDGHWLDVNNALCKITGYSKKELLANNFKNITYPDDVKKSLEILKKFFVSKIDHGFLEKRYIHKKGCVVWVRLSIALVKNSSGEPLYFITHTEDITESKRLEVAKNDFLSLASHQLRTPLSAIRWTLESMQNKKDNLTLKQQEKLNDLLVSNQRLINLVNRLLDVAKIESGQLEINKRYIDLGKLINKLVLSFKVFADKNKKEIKVIIPSKLKYVFSDPVLVNEAMENLISNAINYSLNGSKKIIIRARERTSDYLISVHNEGKIDSFSIDRIKNFEKFVRGIDSPKVQPSGSGLGLYVTKKIMEANGGKVWFKSSAKLGTTFYLTIIKNKK
ncbi:MAG: PAS domain S-box protein [Minisyncoccia bacterium]